MKKEIIEGRFGYSFYYNDAFVAVFKTMQEALDFAKEYN